MKRNHLVITFIVCLLLFPWITQAALNDWRTHTSMSEITGLARSDSLLYATSKGGFFTWIEVDSFFVYYTINEGLPENELTTVEMDISGNLWIGTSSKGLVKFDSKNKTFHTYRDFEGLKINSILPVGDSLLYIGTEDGVSLFLKDDEEVKENYRQLSTDFEIGTAVTDIELIGDTLFCTTHTGIAWAELSHPNLKDPTSWKSIVHWVRLNVIICFNDDIYLGSQGEGFFKLDLKRNRIIKVWSYEDKNVISHFIVNDFYPLGDFLYAATNDGLYILERTSFQPHFYQNRQLTSLEASNDSMLVVGFERDGIAYWDHVAGEKLVPLMKLLTNNYCMDLTLDHNGFIWAASGNVSQLGLSIKAGLHKFQEYMWIPYGMADGYFTSNDVTGIDVDNKGNIWLTMWGVQNFSTGQGGAFVLIDDGIPSRRADSVYAVDPALPNDPLEEKIIAPTVDLRYLVCSDVDVAPTGEIWIANYIQESPPDRLYNYTPSGLVVVDGFPVRQWTRFNPTDDGIATSQTNVVKVDGQGNVWIGGHQTGGLTYIMTAGTPFDKTDDTIYKFSPEDSLLSNDIYDIAIDKDGVVWVTTEGGVNTVTRDGNDFNISIRNSQLDLPINVVNTVEVDPYNNKWFGTSAGLVYMSGRTGETELYTMENSGLVNNNVLSLCYDGMRDVLWIGTEGGISEFSVRTGSSGFGRRVLVYPNPVLLEKGHNEAVFAYLKENTRLMIYTLSGELVNKLDPDWNEERKMYTARWNLSNFLGNLVSSGIYIGVGTDENGSSIKEKFAVIR